MKIKTSTIIYRCLLVGITALVMLVPGAGHNAVFADDNGGFELTDSSRFFIATDDASGDAVPEKTLKRMEESVGTINAQFAAAGVPSDQPLPIIEGRAKRAEAGDIVVQSDPGFGQKLEKQIRSQGYCIKPTDAGTLTVTAGNDDGLWYGMTEVLQRLMAGEPADAEITDAPESAERTLLLDCGRKYYSRGWIENLIKRMSWQRYTSLHLHFSDSQSMRFESKRYPWLNADEYLTYEDLESICETAEKYHIEIIPELDNPGHLEYIVQRYAAHAAEDPDFSFTYDGTTYTAKALPTISNYYMKGGTRYAYSNKGIDIASDGAKAFLWSLIDEYAEFFAEHGCTKFCIGGDELFGWDGANVGGQILGPDSLWTALEHWETSGSAADLFIGYLNDLAEHLAEQGYSCRVWNDEIHRTDDQKAELNQDIDIIYWTNNYTPVEKLAENGNMIHSSNTDWIYYVLREDRHGGDIMDRTRRWCSGENIYENWDPLNCASPTQNVRLIPEESFAGGYFCIWADNPEYKTSETVWDETGMRSWAVAAKLWNHEANKNLPYGKFKKRVNKLGTFPGYSGSCGKDSSLGKSSDIEVSMGLWDRFKAWLDHLI
ncbi:MAG: family 20 glycosylhydrolase [Bacillota bacterium]|nr:family 20 glycosylhydrolase [Bacillota bacterium]